MIPVPGSGENLLKTPFFGPIPAASDYDHAELAENQWNLDAVF
jgi:hypothetical protein